MPSNFISWIIIPIREPDQGLEALVTKPESPPEPEHWKAGGYLSKVPVDPWGKPLSSICVPAFTGPMISGA